MIDNTARVVHSLAFLKEGVTPVLVTGAHFSLMRNARGTMDTGDKRRYDSLVLCLRVHKHTKFGLTGQH